MQAMKRRTVPLSRWVVVWIVIWMPSLWSLTFQDRLVQAEAGCYVVTRESSQYTLLHLHSRYGEDLLLEEISTATPPPTDLSWKEWAESGAQGYTAWTIYHIDLSRSCLKAVYACTRYACRNQEMMPDLLLLKLLTLPLDPVPLNEQIAKSAPQLAGSVNLRGNYWKPPQMIEGCQVVEPHFDLYQGRWCEDHSPLSNKKILFYFDRDRLDLPFPYWVQTTGAGVKFKLFAVDSGTGLQSTHTCVATDLKEGSFQLRPHGGQTRLHLKHGDLR